jgi:hypothetical protein
MLRCRASIALAWLLTRPIRPTHALFIHPRRLAFTQTIAVLDMSELQDDQMCASPTASPTTCSRYARCAGRRLS